MLATAPLAIDVLFVVTVIGTLALVLGGASRAAARVSRARCAGCGWPPSPRGAGSP